MSRIGAIVKKLYGKELRSAANKVVGRRDKKWNWKRKVSAFRDAITKRPTMVWIIRIVVVLVVLVAVAEAIFQFNLLTSWHTIVTARRADVDRELQRRENLIPTLVCVVGRYTAHEQDIFKYVSDARETLKTIRDAEAPKAGSELEKTLSRLIALAEQYPDLKATQSIQDLIKEAANTENRIADAKEKYNKACEIYSQYRTTFPGNVFAFIYRYEPLSYISLGEDVKVPAINLITAKPEGGIEEALEGPVRDLKIPEEEVIEENVEVPSERLDKTEGEEE